MSNQPVKERIGEPSYIIVRLPTGRRRECSPPNHYPVVTQPSKECRPDVLTINHRLTNGVRRETIPTDHYMPSNQPVKEGERGEPNLPSGSPRNLNPYL